MKTITVTDQEFELIVARLADDLGSNVKDPDREKAVEQWRERSASYVFDMAQQMPRHREFYETVRAELDFTANLLERLQALETHGTQARVIEYPLPPDIEAALVEQAKDLSIPVDEAFKVHSDLFWHFEQAAEDEAFVANYEFPDEESAKRAGMRYCRINGRPNVTLHYRHEGKAWYAEYDATGETERTRTPAPDLVVQEVAHV
jgi:hypothetical protein